MIYSQFALFMLRVFHMAHRAVQTPEPRLIDSSTLGTIVISEHKFDKDEKAIESSEEEHTKDVSRTRMQRILGDVQIGALFPIHRKKKGSESCGVIWEQYGIHRTEAALKTIEEINNDSSILPTVRLGIDIRDDCWTERTSMEETIEFIRESIGSAPTSSSDSFCDAHSTNGVNKTNLILAAVVGPGNSDMSIATHNLLQVFRIPQVGYSATTAELSDKGDFKYYMRLVPSDAFQAQALVDIAIHFKWNYIAVIYSNGNYGEKGYEQMQYHIERTANLCIAFSEKIDSLAQPQKFDQLLNSLLTLKDRPKVAICFCEGDTIRRIFEATKRRRMYALPNDTDIGIQWIGSESWSDRQDVVAGIEDIATGAISLRIYSPRVETFDPYYWKLKPSTNTHNPWFVDFWEERFNCSLSQKTAHTYSKKCTGNEELYDAYSYKQDPKLSQVINSIYTVAFGLDAMYRNVCSDFIGRGLCPAMKRLNGSKLFEYMRSVRFNDSHGQEISYDSNGDPPARYDILSFQGTRYILAGEWRSEITSTDNGTTYKHNLTVLADKWMWYDGSFAKDYIIESACSKPCTLGQIKKLQATSCCWTCVRCLDNEYVVDERTCRNCSRGEWPTDNRTSCYKLEIEYLRSASPEAIVVIVLSCIGILATLYSTFIFARFNCTPVVKATTRELSYIILVGIFLCYATTFVIVIQPNTVTCYILRILPGVAFSMIYGALLTKTNRIARILAGSKKRILTKKPRFLSTRAQVVITWVLVSVELIIITAVLIFEPAKADYDYTIPRRVLLVCETSTVSFLAPFGFDFFLITLCTLYAVKTRNLPENFNEAKFIGFTMYTTCIIWLAFITIYFGSNNKGITMCLSFTLSASVALVLLFFPKLYIILFQPHKNVRSSYATTKVIRCHFGTNRSSTYSHSAHDSNRYKPRPSSSGPKTASTMSRPSSKTSMKNETSLTDSCSRLKKTFMRDSLHVSIPQPGPVPSSPVGGGSQQAKEGTLSSSPKDVCIASNDLTVSTAQIRPFRYPLYFHNELSVIEESLMSHDDSLHSQGPASLDQQTLQQTVAFMTPMFRCQESQTDECMFEEYVKCWLLEKHSQLVEKLEANETPSDRRRSSSLHSRGPSFRRRSEMSVDGRPANPEDGEEKKFEFKRTYTEYRKGSKRIRRPDGTRMKIQRQPSIARRWDDGSTEQLAALISHPWKSEAAINEDEDSLRSPFLMRVEGLAPIDAVITSSVEEFKRKNTFKRRNRGQAAATSQAGGQETDATACGEDIQQDFNQQKITAVTPFGDIMAHTLGGAFQTFIGPAVAVDDKANFYITTEVIEEADEETELNQKPEDKRQGLVGRTLECSLDPLVIPAAGDQPPQPSGGGDGSNGSVIGGSTANRLDRKGSLLSRLGHSIRKKIRRFSGDAAAKAFEEFNTIRRYDDHGSHYSIGEPSAAAIAEDFETSVALIEVPENEYADDTEEAIGRGQYQQGQRLHPRLAGSESMETDSGIDRQFGDAANYEEEMESGNRRESMRKGHQYKRSATSTTMASSTSGFQDAMPTSVIANTPASIDTSSASVDAGFVDAQTSISELESLLQSQGLEPRGFSQSTLV